MGLLLLLIETPGINVELTVMVIPGESPNVLLAHGALEVNRQLTTSPFSKVEVVKEGLLLPTFELLICH